MHHQHQQLIAAGLFAFVILLTIACIALLIWYSIEQDKQRKLVQSSNSRIPNVPINLNSVQPSSGDRKWEKASRHQIQQQHRQRVSQSPSPPKPPDPPVLPVTDLSENQIAEPIKKWEPRAEDSELLEDLNRAMNRKDKQNRQPIDLKPTPKPVDLSTKSKLLKLAGSWERVDRIVASVQLKNPNRTEQWCWEKAIWDIERDRMC
jgi:hypothetical protein